MTCGCVPADQFEWRKVKPYLLYVAMFVSTIYTNMRALEESNVETIIVFRAACPLVVCILDWAFLGRQLPSMRSGLSLLVVLSGCLGYVLTDRAFKLNGWAAYQWVGAYFVIISFEMAYGKHIVGPHLGFASMWGPTLYTNFISIPPMLTIGLLTHEETKLHDAQLTATSITLLVLSCIIGVAISYLGWRARSLVTATCYTVLGVANKMLTVLANAMVWDQHASLTGVMFLVVCLLGATGYKQAPMAETMEDEGASSTRKSSSTRKVIFASTALPIGVATGFMFFFNPTPMPPPAPAPLVPPSAVVSQMPGHGAGAHASGHGPLRAGIAGGRAHHMNPSLKTRNATGVRMPSRQHMDRHSDAFHGGGKGSGKTSGRGPATSA